ncbi:MAG: class I SAM-dependent methyltransferase [Saprospiraceae bacterium]|jgi:methylase of polypeptide subunit release factors|nr:class I SAM-dependent methyltransferase [Saprospiraceae bacterium]
MAVFKRNLTSKILEEQSAAIISSKKSLLSVLEVGCGDGNISFNLAKNFPKNSYSASDISAEAISQARLCETSSINFMVSSGIDIWLDQKFDLVICDISAISEQIAHLSDWYEGVSCKTGIDGLEIVMPIIQNVRNILNPGGIFIIPVISLCNVPLQKEVLNSVFSSIEYSKKINWPMPKDLLSRMEENAISLESNYLSVERKFDLVVASTYVATCYT